MAASFIGSSLADAGIVTSRESAQLSMCGNGGVANSLQVACLVRGAEAYVPLPDGRAIPVR